MFSKLAQHNRTNVVAQWLPQFAVKAKSFQAVSLKAGSQKSQDQVQSFVACTRWYSSNINKNNANEHAVRYRLAYNNIFEFYIN